MEAGFVRGKAISERLEVPDVIDVVLAPPLASPLAYTVCTRKPFIATKIIGSSHLELALEKK